MKKLQPSIKQTILLSFSFVFFAASFLTVRAAGEIDPTFNAAIQDPANAIVQKIVIQSDGKIIAAGNFTVANNAGRTGIARFNSDGSVDQTFNPPDFITLTGNGYRISSVIINAVAVQADGKVLLAGNFVRVNNQNRKGLLRLNANGSLDSAFNPVMGSEETVTDIKIQSNGQIVYSGSIAVSGGGQGLTRLNPDGSVDASLQFNRQSRVDSFLIQADGKFIISDSLGIGIYRVNSDGSIDNSFSPATVTNVFNLALQPDGKILIGGSFTTVNGVQRGNIARLNNDGGLDASFNPGGAGANGTVRSVAVLSDGKIAIGGNFNTFNGMDRLRNSRLNSDGTVDLSFNYNPGVNSVIYAVAATGDGGVILGGYGIDGEANRVARIRADGSLDTGFAAAAYQVGAIYQVLIQPDGKILIASNSKKINGISKPGVARLNIDGSVDTGFTSAITGVGVFALQPDGKIIVTSANGLRRLNSDGSLDPTFQQSPISNVNIINEITVLPDGKIIVAGDIRLSGVDVGVLRLNSNGSEDTTFNRVNAAGGSVAYMVTATKIQPDGKIIIGGDFTQINGSSRQRIARLNSDGTLDTSFNLVFGTNGTVRDLALQSNGSIIIGGDFSSVNGAPNYYYLARILPNVTLDTSFKPTPNAQVYTIAVQPDDKILIGGVFDAIGGVSQSKLSRLNANGTIDNAFNAKVSANDIVRNVQLQNDGKILVGGDFNRISGISSVGLARLLTTTVLTRTLFDFDGDGKSDVSVFRPGNGSWYIQQSQAGFSGLAFGISTDKLVPADYDGDGKTDVAVYRGGTWYLQRSTAGFTGIAFGDGNDIPVPADYDGDGRADLAVFRPSNGTWYIQRSQLGFTGIAFGQTGDKPVPADYDGDGKSDIAVNRSGTWYIQRSQLGFYGVQFGDSNDKLVPADYDGDGKADIAVFRPSNGTWYIQQSTNGFTGIAFGLGTDIPVTADYDGDGKTDVAVVRNGNWYLNRTTQGFIGIQFGTSTDLPIPNAFVR